MTTFVATLVDSETGAGNDYRFEDADSLLDEPANRVVDRFFAKMNDKHLVHQALHYDINKAFRSDSADCVTGWGSLILQKGKIPYMVMIAPADRDQPVVMPGPAPASRSKPAR